MKIEGGKRTKYRLLVKRSKDELELSNSLMSILNTKDFESLQLRIYSAGEKVTYSYIVIIPNPL